MNTLKRFMVVLNNADKYPTEHELAEVAWAAKDKLNRLVEHRDAALKLAQKWKRSERRFDRTGGNLEYYAYNGDRCAAELRAIFEPKDEK